MRIYLSRLEEYLRKKLISSGWKDGLKQHCKELIREKGIEKVTVPYLIGELETRGKHTVPTNIREDVLARVKKYIEEMELQ